MKFGIMFANAGPFAYPEPLAHLARSAEETGFESIWTVEHVVVPVGYQSEYPYSESGTMPGAENVPIRIPFCRSHSRARSPKFADTVMGTA